jgi:poly-beta-1,6-N-acetyl-D-glucosamine synthase
MDWGWLNWFTYLGIIYAVLYTGSKLIFSFMSLLEIRIYFWRYDHIIEEHELQEHLEKNHHELPLISIISPAYNEGVLIIDTVSSFLNQSYRNKEVIICSDGGTDGTLEKLIEYFELYEVQDTFTQSPAITHKPIKRYFRSANPKYNELLVLDKVNGGKADAQNAGVAIARGEIVTIIDADSILEKYALIHLADIFEREGRVVGVGTPIGVVNDCNVGPDGVDDASVPKSFWAKIQVIEYLRSFLLGRMFAQRYRGLQIVSGAFGVYKKWILEAVGGYTTGSLAEDMDIDGKIWRYIDSNKLNYRIRYIPEAFCWSEVPNTFKSLASQRDRWARGMTETIWKNRDLFFNPKFKMLGLFSYPYYVFFEWLTPFIEVIGLLYFIIGASLGWFSFYILEYIFIAYWLIGVFLNIVALSVEAITRGHYKNRTTLLRLSLFAVIEPLFYHWINSYLYVVGNLKMLLFRKRGWGEMERVGLKKSEGNQKASDSIANDAESIATHIPVANAMPTESIATVQTETTHDGVVISNTHDTPKANSSVYWWAAVFLIGILSLAGYWYFRNSEREPQQISSVPKPEVTIQQMKQDTAVVNAVDSIVGQHADSAYISEQLVKDSVVQEQQTIPIEQVVVTQQLRSGIIDTVMEKTGTYYIIVASVLNPEFVQEYTRKLSKKGIDSVIIPNYTTHQYNLVSVSHSADLDDAKQQLAALKPEYGDGIWILKY